MSKAIIEKSQIYLGSLNTDALNNSAILYTRLGCKVSVNGDLYVLSELKSGNRLGKVPRIPLSRAYKKATKQGETGMTEQEWQDAEDALTSYVLSHREAESDLPVLIQEVWAIPEIDFIELFIKKTPEVVKVLKNAILQDIAESLAIVRSWHKIKHYHHPVTLRISGEAFSVGIGIFSDEASDALNEIGIRRLNDVRKYDIYTIKNTLIDHDFDGFVRQINAAFKEDRARRNDKNFKIVPFVLCAIALVPTIVISFMYQYTLLKNMPMTLVIIAVLALWLLSVVLFAWGVLRTPRRRRKRPEYRYFTRSVVANTICMSIISLFSVGSVCWFYEFYDGYDDDFYYRKAYDGYIEVAGLVDDDMDHLVLPDEIDGKQVIGVGWFAFYNNDFSSIEINDNIEYIHARAFYGCKNLGYITLSDNITAIPDFAFYGCENLAYISAPGVTEIGNSAFAKCGSLSSVKDIDRLEKLGKKAFFKCGSLGRFVVGDTSALDRIGNKTFMDCNALYETNVLQNATYIGQEAFKNCENLTSVTISPDAEHIGYRAFKGCSNIETLSLPFVGKKPGNKKNVKYLFGSDCNVKILTLTSDNNIKDYAFRGAHSLVKVIIKGNITKIGNNAFRDCSALEEVELPSTLETLGNGAFRNCKVLRSVLGGDLLKNLGNKAFYKCPMLESVDFDQIAKVGKQAFAESGILEFDFDFVQNVGDSAFENCGRLTEVILPSGAKYGKNVFKGCNALAYVQLPSDMINIPDGMFSGCAALTTVKFNSGTEKIGKQAFMGCGLTDIVLPDGILKIGQKAFYDCDSLYSIVIPDTVKTVGQKAFGNCDMLFKATLPFLGKSRALYVEGYRHIFGNDSPVSDITITDMGFLGSSMFAGSQNKLERLIAYNVEKVRMRTFKGFASLQYVELSDQLTSVGEAAFRKCSSLVEIRLPDSLSTIKWNTFRDCEALERVVGGNGVTRIGKNAFRNCPQLNRVDLNAVEVISDKAFYGCANLVSIEHMSALENIGADAFNGCTSLETFSSLYPVKIGKNAFANSGLKRVILRENLEKVNAGAFKNCFDLTSVDMYNVDAKFGKNVFENCQALEDVVLPANMTALPEGLFRNCSALIDVRFSEGVKKIGKRAFAGTGIYDINLPSSLQEIGKEAFKDCYNLQEIVIPDNVKTIRLNAFASCYNLYKATLPFLGKSRAITGSGYRHTFGRGANVTSIVLTDTKNVRSFTFSGAKNVLESVDLQGVERIKMDAFKSFSQLTDIKMYDTLKKIGARAFKNCTQLEELHIPDSVTFIGDEVARGDSALSTLTISNSVKRLHLNAFRDCDALTTVYIPDGVATIGKQAFRDCDSLTNVYFGNDVKTIGIRAFRNCMSLNKIVFGDNIQHIKKAAFRDCISLNSIELPDSLKKIEMNAFKDCMTLENFVMPDSVKTMGSGILDGCHSLRTVSVPFVGATRILHYRLSYLTDATEIDTLRITSAKHIKSKFFANARINTLVISSPGVKINKSALSSIDFIQNVILHDSLKRYGQIFEDAGASVTYSNFSQI